MNVKVLEAGFSLLQMAKDGSPFSRVECFLFFSAGSSVLSLSCMVGFLF